MKNIICIVLLAGFLSALSAHAQYPTFAAQSLSVPTSMTKDVTTNLASPPIIDVRRQQYVALSSTMTSMNAAGSTNIYTLWPSVDGVNFDTNAANSTFFTNAMLAAGPVTVVKTINPGGYGYYKVTASQCLTGNYTNASLSYGLKISSP